jgi:antitoxin HicB
MGRTRTTAKKAKGLDYYLHLRYPITLYPAEEGGFVAEIRDLPGCLTQAETATEVFELIEDAKRGWLALALDRGMTIPEPKDDYSGRFVVRIPKDLHRQLAETAASDGVSLNQLVLTLLAGGLPATHLNRGSNASRSPSPSRLNPITVRKIATPGRVETHHASRR